MCLPDFIEFKQIDESEALTGYRIWKNSIKSEILRSECVNYEWFVEIIGHEVTKSDSGIYAYSKYNYNYYNCNYFNNYYFNNYNYSYYIFGIIKQYGKVAIHRDGQRSEFAKIDTLFQIRLGDAEGPKEFLDWITIFNSHIEKIAKRYNVPNLITWQDFLESQK